MQMTRAKCACCAWVFDLVSSPMPVTLWAETAKRRAACPICGNANTLMADPRPLTDDEIACKHRVNGAASASAEDSA